MSRSGSSGSGVGFAGLLTVLFIGLKLTGFVDWPWLWVLAPLWIGFIVGVLILSVVAVIACKYW